jgi:NarL family two-component system sensor histidine kinase YdfH
MISTPDRPLESETYPLPLFIFLSLLSAGVVLSLVLNPSAALPAVARITLPLLLALHLFLHWRSINWIGAEKQWLGYALAQSVLAALFALLGRNPSLWAVLLIWLVAETIGLLDKPRPVALTLFLYIPTAVASLFAVMDQATALSWLGAVLPTAVFIALVVVLYKQQVAARAEAQRLVLQLEAANRQISKDAEQIEALTLTNERQRMARELHDTLAQGLAGLLMQLEASNAHLAAGRYERAQTIVAEAMTRARSTLADARAAIDDLRSQEAPALLSRRLAACGRRFEQANNLPCRCQVEIGVWDRQLTIEQQEQLEQIVAEALTNVHRHAQASATWVEATVQDETLLLEIGDDGRGFDPTQPAACGHYGLQGLRERATLLGGELTIESAPGEGTTIFVSLPLNASPVNLTAFRQPIRSVAE